MKKIVTKKASVRLPQHVSPEKYVITLAPDLLAHTFTGEETITLALAKATSEITLHSVDLNITNAVIKVGKEQQTADAISYDEKAETATLHFAKKIPIGTAKLSLVWNGILSDNMRGFYKSKYTVNGEDRFMATTQFEATDARRAFPCFDEPAQKAVFEVSLIVPAGKTAISNTLESTIKEHAAGLNIVSFAPSPKMSTYLVAFLVGDFEYIEGKTKRGVKVRVFTVPGKKEQGRFSLECALKTLDFYEEYFAIKYPLPVLDMIAIPDFAAGAMENWGAVTYRETILIDGETGSLATRQWVAIVVAHELAHQWFGNLVTMEWWTHLWLNEGFASYIEYLAVDKLFPEWHMWEQFLLQDHGPALRLDALASTHPIEVEVHHPSEIGEIFDEVSYSKGAAVIRMLAEYLGPKNFRDGLRHYLKLHSYKNTETVHLWESFEKVSKLPVKKMMQHWTGMPGYPVMFIEQKGEKYTLSQKRFFSSVLEEKKAKSTQSWMIPLAAASEEGMFQSSLMNKKQMTLPIKRDWLKLNPGESALYRTAYSTQMLAQLREPVAARALPAADRLGIIRDLFALTESGMQPVTEALSMLSSYRGDDAYIVWGEIISGIGKVSHVFGDTESEKLLRQYALGVVQQKAESIGWEKGVNEEPNTAFLRSMLLYAAGHYGDMTLVRKAQALFVDRNKIAIHPDVRGVVYMLVAEHGGQTEWDELVAMYRAAKIPEEKNRIGRALMHFRQKKLISASLTFALSKDVRSQDAPSLLAIALSSRDARELTWQFIQKNWKELDKRYSSGGHMLPRLIAPLSAFTDKKYAVEIKAFFKKNPAPGAARTIDQAVEKILSNDAWKKRDAKKLAKWLKSDKV